MLDQRTLTFSSVCTSLPGSEDGSTPFSWPDGQTDSPSGPGVAPVSPFRSRARAKVKPIAAISGRNSFGSSASRDLQSSLASRLVVVLDCNGSMEYSLTWKPLVTPAGRQIYRLRARARRTYGSACSGWPTPIVNDAKGSAYTYSQGNHDKPTLKLPGVPRLAGWTTPTASEMRTKDPKRLLERRRECKKSPGNGNGSWRTLGNQVILLLASTETPGALNPDFVRWLMGYSPEHLNCAPTVTRSSHK